MVFIAAAPAVVGALHLIIDAINSTVAGVHELMSALGQLGSVDIGARMARLVPGFENVRDAMTRVSAIGAPNTPLTSGDMYHDNMSNFSDPMVEAMDTQVKAGEKYKQDMLASAEAAKEGAAYSTDAAAHGGAATEVHPLGGGGGGRHKKGGGGGADPMAGMDDALVSSQVEMNKLNKGDRRIRASLLSGTNGRTRDQEGDPEPFSDPDVCRVDVGKKRRRSTDARRRIGATNRNGRKAYTTASGLGVGADRSPGEKTRLFSKRPFGWPVEPYDCPSRFPP
jgi:hypothetical protein